MVHSAIQYQMLRTAYNACRLPGETDSVLVRFDGETAP